MIGDAEKKLVDDAVKKYQEAKDKLQSLSLRLASEEASYKTLKAQYEEKIAILKDTYKVASLEEAASLVTRSLNEITESVNKFNEALKVITDQDINL